MEIVGSNPAPVPAPASAAARQVIENLQGRVSNLVPDGDGNYRLRKKILQEILEQFQRNLAVELMRACDSSKRGVEEEEEEEENEAEAEAAEPDVAHSADSERDELCDILKSRVESPAFLDKVESLHASIAQGIRERGADEANSWDVITETDLMDDEYKDARNSLDQESYVLVRQEDIVEGIACFMATYLSTVKDTKDLSPKKLQKALSKTFSTRKRKGKLRMMWDSSKVIYNVVSWGATAVGLYQNPALFQAASVAFWTTCRVVSKFI